MKKRLLAILLSLMMVLSLLPVGVFAADAEGTGTGAELAELFTKANAGVAGSGDVTVKIDKDYNLTGYDWTSLTVDGYRGAGIVTVEGNGHTITGLNAPLFAGGFAGTSGIVIKNLTLTKVNVNDTANKQGIGAFINNVDSMPKIKLDNCHLTDSKIISTGGARVGGLIGWTSGYNKPDDGPVDTYITVTNCSVENTQITAKGSVGGIIGHAGCNPATFHTFTDNTVTGCTLNSTDNGGWRVGVVVGTANVGEISIANTTESNNTIAQTDKTAPEGQSDLYGRFVPDTTGKLVIDGVPVFNSDIVAAIGNTGYKTLADAVKAVKDNETITLLKNVTVTKPIEVAKSMTLDLNGHVLTAATTSDRSNSKDEKNSAIWVTAEKVNLTIDGTTAGSGMKMGDTHETEWTKKVWGFVDLRDGSTGSTVTVNGGSYAGSTCASDNYHYTALFTVGSESKLVLNNVIAETDERVVKASSCGEVVVSGGTYNITGIDAFLGAAFETKTASFTNMKLTAKYGGCVQVGNNATFENCEINVTDIRTGDGPYLNCAVAVWNGGTATVKSGIYTAPYAAYVYSSGGTINIENGTFTGVVRADATTGTTATINIENGSFKGEIQKGGGPGSETIAITGGLFSSKPAKEYIANGYYVDAFNNGEYPYTVKEGTAPDTTLVVVKDVAPDTAIAKDITDDNTKTAIESVQSKTSVQGVGAAVFDNKDTLVKNSDVKTEGATEVKVEVKVNVTVNAADLTSENKTMTFEAKPVATVTTIKEDGTQVDKKEGIEVPNGLLNGEITVTLPLPMGFDVAKLEQVKHISGNSVEYFLKTTKTGAKTFEIDKDSNCVILKITHFSTFELSTKSDYVEPVYTSAPITKKDVKFDDVDVNAYYAPAVKWAVENKITAGKTDKLFAPDDTCTRGEMITFLWNAAGKPAVKNTTNPFTDVNAGAFYYDAVLWAVSNGITSGTTDTTFSPDNTVSRAQVVAFLYNYANKPAAANSTFSDVAADAYYAPAVGWAAAQKITSGTGNNTFSPENDCTRAQIVTFLYNDLAK